MSVLTAQGAGVRHRGRWLFRDLDLAVEPGELVAVVGPPGSGRTTLLLALAGRFRLSAGKIKTTGTAVLGYVPDVEAPEPVFTVAEHVRERLALLGRRRGEAVEVPLHGLDPAVQGRDLTPYEKQVLGVILAGLSGPGLVALDGFDAGLDVAEQDRLWGLLGELTAAGVAVVITAREVDPARVSTVIRLGAGVTPPAPVAEDWSPPTRTQKDPDEEPPIEPAPAAGEWPAGGGMRAGVDGEWAAEDGAQVGPGEGSAAEDGARFGPGEGVAAEDGAHAVPGKEPAADNGLGTMPAVKADEVGKDEDESKADEVGKDEDESRADEVDKTEEGRKHKGAGTSDQGDRDGVGS